MKKEFFFKVILLLNTIIVIPVFAYSQICFGPPKFYTVSSDAVTITSGDYNSDGRIDIAVANYETRDVSVLINKDDTSFYQAVSYPLAVYWNIPRCISTGDLNGDENPDLIVVGCFYGIDIFFGNSNGVFDSCYEYYYPGWGEHLTTGDFNNDSKLDIALANCNNSSVDVFYGNGAGSFSNINVFPSLGDCPVCISSGYLNSDTLLDIAVSNGTSSGAGSSVVIFLNQGNGSFSQGEKHNLNFSPLSLAVADYNGDSHNDIALGDWFIVPILMGSTHGTFSISSVPDTMAYYTNALIAADIDNNGTADLISGDGGLCISPGLGNGTFGNYQTFSCSYGGYYGYDVTAGYFNSDNKLDLAMALSDWDVGIVSVLYNCTQVGVNKVKDETELIKIFPNPANKNLFIEGLTTKASAEIYDISGKLLLSIPLTTNQIDISRLAKGLYFIKLSTAEGSMVSKFVKE
jgi:hypothetical protein